MVLTEKTLFGVAVGVCALGVQALALAVLLDDNSQVTAQREFLASIVAKNMDMVSEGDLEKLRDLNLPIKKIEG